MDRCTDAVDRGDLELLQSCLDADATLADRRDEDGQSLVLRALYRRQTGAALLLARHRTALDAHEAAALGELDALAAALQASEGPPDGRSVDGFTPLHYAAFFDRPEAAKLLLQAGADPDRVAANSTRVRPLHSAAAAGSTLVVTLLLEAGADADAPQQGGFTALMSAALHGRTELVDTLLQHGASPQLAADDGRVAADFAREGGHEALATRLS